MTEQPSGTVALEIVTAIFEAKTVEDDVSRARAFMEATKAILAR